MPNASSWRNGNSRKPYYGLRVSKNYRDSNFVGIGNTVELYLQGYSGNPVKVNLTKSFWSKCLELRSKDIGLWFIYNHKGSWKRKSPHRYTLSQRNNSNIFDIC